MVENDQYCIDLYNIILLMRPWKIQPQEHFIIYRNALLWFIFIYIQIHMYIQIYKNVYMLCMYVYVCVCVRACVRVICVDR